MQTIKKILQLINKNQKIKVYSLLTLIIFMALFDMIGIASIVHFINIITHPEIIHSNFLLKELYEFSNKYRYTTFDGFVYLMGIIVFLIIFLSLILKTLTLYFQNRFVAMLQYSISKRMFSGYMKQSYSWFFDRHSADLIKNILSEVSVLIGNTILPLLNLLSHAAVALVIIILLLIADIKLALISFSSISVAYLLIYLISRIISKRIGEERLKANRDQYTAATEAFGGIKEIKASNLENTLINKFKTPAKIVAKNQATLTIINQMPRFFLEAIIFGGMLIILLYLISTRGNFLNSIPIITLYALAGYRLMPSLQQIYSSLNQFKYAGSSLDNIYIELKNMQSDDKKNLEEVDFNDCITLENISYSYPKSKKIIINNISIKITKNSCVGIVGTTGSGKTTLIDLILGLLEVSEGHLRVDNIDINKKNILSWQKKIGYVPQNIFLLDASIEENIAFGLEPDQMDYDLIVKSAKIANIHDFIINDLPLKYQTNIGEKGIRLSGGQKQRIGIARAFYKNPEVIIFDEATSSLDIETEKEVMEELYRVKKKITLIIIAHRQDTLNKCDRIFKVIDGNIIEQKKLN